MGTNVIAFVVVLGVLIFFHELGHFLVARLFSVGVERFSLGFGPRLVGKRIGRTDYRISAFPLGGYVKMVGDEPGADLPAEDIPVSFTHKPVWQRMLIVAAGPLFNLLLCVLIFFAAFWVQGEYVLDPVVGQVQEGSPAHKAGIREGDRIAAIDGRATDSWQQMAEAIAASKGRPLVVTIQRQGQRLELSVQPQATTVHNLFGEPERRYVIGIRSSGQYHTIAMGPLSALAAGFSQTWELTRLTVVSVVKIVQGTVSTKTLGGPIMIAQMAGEQAKAGVASLVGFIALLSVNLAVLNFLPIPVLDGGHLVFFLIEAVRGRPVSIRTREIAQQAGIFLLILLMLFVFYNDITRLFGGAS